MQWLSQNWIWIAFVIGVLLLMRRSGMGAAWDMAGRTALMDTLIVSRKTPTNQGIRIAALKIRSTARSSIPTPPSMPCTRAVCTILRRARIATHSRHHLPSMPLAQANAMRNTDTTGVAADAY